MPAYENSTAPDSGTAQATHPQANLLLGALEDCCHPRAERLRSRLLDCSNAQNLDGLRAEVHNLLALSFGRAEAELRLRAP